MALSLFGGGGESDQGQAANTIGRKKILLCEDDKFFSQALTLILTNAGYGITTAADGQQGITALGQDSSFDLILCDIMMPVMDGFGVLKEVKAHPEWSQIPFIFLTGVSDFESMDRATELGARDYFIKAQAGLPKIVETVKKYIE